MAEDEDKSSKTEEPTQRKLQRLRDEGNVPKSREVNNFMMMLAMFIMLLTTLKFALMGLVNLVGTSLTEAGKINLDSPEAALFAFENALFSQGVYFIPTFALLMVMAYVGGVMQTGFLLSAKPIQPKLERISLIKGFGRLFNTRALAEFMKSVVKLVVVGALCYFVMFTYLSEVVLLNDKTPLDAVRTVYQILIRMLAAVIAVAFSLAVVDYLFQRAKFLKEQRMSRRELKDEFKEQEGDPYIKARQRQIREQRARQRMMQDVPQASVIVTNPTHYAVALKYEESVDAAPIVVAKGADFIALKIREKAKEHNVPFYEDPPLARQLYADVEIGQVIPFDLFEAVARVIAYVYKLKRRVR